MMGHRQDILEAAFEVFARHGYDKTSMNEIATAAGISKGTVYLYFKSKRALFWALYMQLMTCFVTEIQQCALQDAPPADKLRACIGVSQRVLQQHGDFARVMPDMMIQAMQNEELFETSLALNETALTSVSQIIQEGIDNGDFCEVDPDLTAITILSAVSGVLNKIVLYPDADLSESLDLFTHLILRGLHKGGKHGSH